MENQETNRSDKERDTKGRWLVGYAPNPTGKNGQVAGHARWDKRVEQLEKQFPDIDSLRPYFAIERGPFGSYLVHGEAFGKLNPYDAGIVWNMILQTFAPRMADALMAQQNFWDRRNGKAPASVKLKDEVLDDEQPSGIDVAARDKIVEEIIELAAARKASGASGKDEMGIDSAPRAADASPSDKGP